MSSRGRDAILDEKAAQLSGHGQNNVLLAEKKCQGNITRERCGTRFERKLLLRKKKFDVKVDLTCLPRSRIREPYWNNTCPSCLGQYFKPLEKLKTCCGQDRKFFSHPVDDQCVHASIPSSQEELLGTKLELRAYSLKMHAGHHNRAFRLLRKKKTRLKTLASPFKFR